MTRYRGFSTIGKTKKFRLADAELIKQDLINHFSIKKGQKLMNPNFGSIVWNMLFEPITEDVKATIVEDVKRIVNYDPRIRIDEVLINELDYGIQIQIDLTFLPQNFADSLRLEFNSNTNTLLAV